MKKIVSRFLISVGAMTAAPAPLLAQEHSGISIGDVCSKPEYAEQSKKLWGHVQAADKTEVYIAYLEACGSSAQTAEYAAIAREIVVQRTANFTRMPRKVERIVWEDSNPNGFTSIYVY
ncbi:MAG: hypothetical protein EON48_03320 [Acetobacteraceae bacterium]|nr:MAG: hypothetical protein EON48_03320 [Acetobacteraceae bacterium]